MYSRYSQHAHIWAGVIQRGRGASEESKEEAKKKTPPDGPKIERHYAGAEEDPAPAC